MLVRIPPSAVRCACTRHSLRTGVKALIPHLALSGSPYKSFDPLPWPSLLPLLLAQISIPGISDSGLDKPASSVDPNYFEMLERNSHIVYPSLALVVLALVAVAILQASRAQDMDGAVKAEFKKLIIDELRRYPAGLDTPELADLTGLERGKLVRLLDQMLQEGVLVSHMTTQRQTVWRVNGLGGRRY